MFGSRTLPLSVLLSHALVAFAIEVNLEIPDYLPILGYEMLSAGPDIQTREGANPAAEYTLPTLLSKVLLASAIQYERESHLSLAISANILRLLTDEGTLIRDLPRLSGVSKEAIAMAMKRLEASGLALVQSKTKGKRVKALTLTAKGRQARDGSAPRGFPDGS